MKRLIAIILILSTFQLSAQETLLPVAKNGKWGLVNTKGQYILDNQYEYIEFHEISQAFTYNLKNKKGIISHDGRVSSPPIYDHVIFLDSHWVTTKKGDHWNLQKEQDIKLDYAYDSVRKVAPDCFIAYTGATGQLFHANQGVLSSTFYKNAIAPGKGILCAQTSAKKYHVLSQKTFTQLITDIDTIRTSSAGAIIAQTKNGEIITHPDSTKLIGDPRISYQYLRNNYYKASKSDGSTELFNLETATYYPAPELDELEVVNLPYLHYTKNGQSGIWDLEKNKTIVPAQFETITPIKNGYLTGSFEQFGIYNKKGEVVLPAVYELIAIYELFYVVKKANKFGLYNLSGKEVLPMAYNRIAVYDHSVKCYRQNQLTVVKMDDAGNLTSEKTYDEFMSVTIEKERLPRQRSEAVNFGGNGSGTKIINGSAGGWYRPLIERKKEDTIIKVRGRWGLKDPTDSTRIRPQFAKIQRSRETLITKAYHSRPIQSNNLLLNNGANIKTIQVAHGISVAYNAPFQLVNDSTFQFLLKKKLLEAYVEDFASGEIARVFDGELFLIDRSGRPVRKKLNYFGQFKENRLRICEGGELAFSAQASVESVSKTTHYFARLGAILCSGTTEKDYVHIDRGQWYILDRNGNQLNDTAFQYIEEFQDGLAIAKRHHQWGVVDTGMRIIIPFQYGRVDRIPLNDTSYFRVSEPVNAHYLYNKTNGQLRETQLTSLQHYANGKWFSKSTGQKRWTLIDTNFNELSAAYDFVSPFQNESALAVNSGKRTLLNPEGQPLLGLYKARKIVSLGGDRFGLIQRRGTTVINTIGDTLVNHKNCREVLASTSHYLIFENRAREIEVRTFQVAHELPKKYRVVSFDLEHHIFLVEKKGKMKLFDLSTGSFRKMKLKNALSVSDGTILYRGENGNFGFLSYSGDTLCPPKFEELTPLENGWAFAKEKKFKGPVNKHGVYLFKEKVFRILPLANVFQFYTAKGIGIMNKNASIIIEPGYKSIEWYNGFYKAQLYNLHYDLYDTSGKKLNDRPYKDIKAIAPNSLIVRDGDFDYLYSGFLNKSLCFQHIRPVSTQLYLLDEKSLYGLYDPAGKLIIPIRYHKVEPLKDRFQVSFFNSFGYYDGSGLALGDPRPNDP